MKTVSKIKNKLSMLNRIRQKKGWSGVKSELTWLLRRYRERQNYRKWMKSSRITENGRREIFRQIENFKHKPKISVILPLYEISEKLLRSCIESVRNQLYENWQLCIADDCSPSKHVRKILEEFAAQDKRIKVVFREKNG